VKAVDIDDSSGISYKILNESTVSFFRIDENTGELVIRKDILPPGNYSFRVEASDGTFKAITSVRVAVTDINNHSPTFTQTTLDNRVLVIPEDVKVGSIIATIQATDEDMDDNGFVQYSIDKGAYGTFEINEDTGEISLVQELDNDKVPSYDLLVTAYDAGTPPTRTSTTIQVNVGDVFVPLPKIWPTVQRAQVSESAEIGDVATTLTTNFQELGLSLEDLDLKFQFIDPVEARNYENKHVNAFNLSQVLVYIQKQCLK
jgi:hypothetical protein